jgi:hypothetical protein
MHPNKVLLVPCCYATDQALLRLQVFAISVNLLGYQKGLEIQYSFCSFLADLH